MELALKYKLVEKLIQTENENILQAIKVILGLPETDFWQELPLEVKAKVEQSKKQLDKRLGTPHEQVMMEIKSRLT